MLHPGTPSPEETAASLALDIPDRDRLAAELYPELHRIAAAKLRRERSDHTLQPTALVNELWLHILRNPDVKWKDRNHFLLAASQAMHRYLVDHARARRSHKRGGKWRRTDSVVENLGDAADPAVTLEVDELLERLRQKEPRMASVLEMRFFGGLTFLEIAAVLGMDERTAKRDWTLARAWFRGHLTDSATENEGGRVGED